MQKTKTFQVNNEYCDEFTAHFASNGKVIVTFEAKLSPREALEFQMDVVSPPSLFHRDSRNGKLPVLSRTGVKPTKHEPYAVLNGALSNIPKAKLASQY
jgi:hypothetical protein